MSRPVMTAMRMLVTAAILIAISACTAASGAEPDNAPPAESAAAKVDHEPFWDRLPEADRPNRGHAYNGCVRMEIRC